MNICITKLQKLSEQKRYQEIKLKGHLFTNSRLNRSVFTLGIMTSWPLSLRALVSPVSPLVTSVTNDSFEQITVPILQQV